MAATVALIAHDRKKEDIVQLVQQHHKVLSRYHLIATGTTGQRIQAGTNLSVERMLSGPMGGDAQISALIAAGKITAVIFLIDPLYAQPHEPDIQALQRLCALYNVPLAINWATAVAILDQLRRSRVAHLIFNPVSGQGDAASDLALIQEMLEPGMALAIHHTTPETSAETLAREAVAAHADLVIASGGDGTVSAVADALIGTPIPLGIIPRGTANAFAFALGLPRVMPIRRACEIILAHQIRRVDAARCNGLPMILLAGIGFEAETIERTAPEAKDRWGPLAYIMAGLQQFRDQELFDAELEVEGVVKHLKAAAVTIANAAPPSSVMAQGSGTVNVTDGLLDVTISAPQSDLEAVTAMADLLGSALMQSPTNRDDIISFQTQRIRVTTTPAQKVVLDGELIGKTPIEVECIPEGLIVLAPEGFLDSSAPL